MADARRAALEELARRKRWYAKLEAGLHPSQKPVWRSTARRIAALCGRRAGKTTLMRAMIIRELVKCGRGDYVGFAAKTKGLAKHLVWKDLRAICDELGLDWRFNEQELTITTTRGGTFVIGGFDALPELEKMRGLRFRAFFLDEIAMVADAAEYIIKQAVGPATMDLAGLIMIAGTPGPALTGFWWQASTGQPDFEMWERHHWTYRENLPMIAAHPSGDLAVITAEIFKENAYNENSTGYRREYLAEWVPETTMLVLGDYDAERHVRVPPTAPLIARTGGLTPGGGWRFAMGIDFGVTDPTAWVVLGWHIRSRIFERAPAWVVHAEKKPGLTASEVSDHTKKLVELYRPLWVVGDAAGASYVLDFNRRYAEELGTWIIPAQKQDVVGQVDMMNMELRGDLLLLLPEAAAVLGPEFTTCLWQDEHRLKIKRKQEDHGMDATRYILKHSVGMRGTLVLEPENDPLQGFMERARRELERQGADGDDLRSHWG